MRPIRPLRPLCGNKFVLVRAHQTGRTLDIVLGLFAAMRAKKQTKLHRTRTRESNLSYQLHSGASMPSELRLVGWARTMLKKNKPVAKESNRNWSNACSLYLFCIEHDSSGFKWSRERTHGFHARTQRFLARAWSFEVNVLIIRHPLRVTEAFWNLFIKEDNE